MYGVISPSYSFTMNVCEVLYVLYKVKVMMMMMMMMSGVSPQQVI